MVVEDFPAPCGQPQSHLEKPGANAAASAMTATGVAAPGGCRSQNLSSSTPRQASLRTPEPLCAADAD